MVRSVVNRSKKYEKKLVGLVGEERLNALKEQQVANNKVSLLKQMELDSWIKSLHLGMNEVYYIIFAKQINKLIDKFRGDILEEEVTGKKDLWVARGLSSATLDDIMTRFNITPPAPPVDWLGSFNYRREVTVTNGGGVLSAFQIKVELTNVNFDFTHAESDGKDIRITKTDKLTKLDYWVESWDNVGETAVIWVEADSLTGTGDTSLYLYFGDNAVVSESNGDDTFLFFDDFDDGSLDLSKWTINSGTEDIDFWERNGYLEVIGNAGNIAGIEGTNIAYPLIFEYRAKFSSTQTNLISLGVVALSGINDFVLYTYNSDGNMKGYTRASGSITWISTGSALTGMDDWQIYKFEWLDTPSAKIFYDSTQFGPTVTTNVPSVNMGAYIRGYTSGSGILYVDWARARKYASPEPTNAIGSEESKP